MLKEPSLNPRIDCLLSQSADWSDDVLHVLNDNYLGIRAAVSALPGQKLVLPNIHWHYQRHLSDALDQVKASGARQIVVHGMSNATYEVAKGVLNTLPAITLHGVWHGGPSQWVSQHEASEFARFLELDGEGAYRRSHIMKPGCNVMLQRPAGDLLLNCAPRRQHPLTPAVRGRALVPAPPSLHKNLYGNLCAAELCTAITHTYHYAQLAPDPMKLLKTRELTYVDPVEHQKFVATCEVVLNASTMDCHPMIDLEAAAVGRPSVHMKLGLPVLDEHPLGVLATIADAGSISSILEAVERVLDVPPDVMLDMALDYASVATREGISRMATFLYD